MQHAVLAARTIVTAQSSEDERAALLGYIGASYGLGFALGPAAGGLLSSVSLQATAWAAAAGSVLALGIAAVGLPAGKMPVQQLAAVQQCQMCRSLCCTL
jgi:MFS family permease